MARTKVFVSYSHLDNVWRRRLLTHLAVLERLDLLETWDDTRIQVGDEWRAQIDDTLKLCQVAVLLVSANFLAGDFIQSVEVPVLLERHERDGLIILPVIARPCAWRLVDFLARHQCRPQGGRAMSFGTKPQIDEDLAILTYEIADLVGWKSSEVATEIDADGERASHGAEQSEAKRLANESSTDLTGRSWEGGYGPIGKPANRAMMLFVDSVKAGQFRGRAIWPGEQAVTTFVEGIMTPLDGGITPSTWDHLFLKVDEPSYGLRFTDTRQEGGFVEIGGQYLAVLGRGLSLRGVWSRRADGAALGQFELLPTVDP